MTEYYYYTGGWIRASVVNTLFFKASLLVDSLLNNRDNAKETKKAFKQVMFSTSAEKVKVFVTGDDDIITGLVIASKHSDGNVYFVTFITD